MAAAQVCKCGIVLDGSNPCPVCQQAAVADVSLQPVQFGTERAPTDDLNQLFGFRPRLLEQTVAATEDDDRPYKVLDAPKTLPAAEEDEYRKIADILRTACRENRQPTWQLETHWSECLLFPARGWPILFSLAFGYSLMIPIGMAIFFSSARPDTAGLLWFIGVWGTLTAGLVGYTAGFWLCVLMSAFHGEAGVIRWPGGEIGLVAHSLALAIGCFVAGPALLLAFGVWYWLNAGELTIIDNVILTELALAAVCWWFFAFVSAVKGKSILAAAPLHIVQISRRMGKSSLIAAFVLLGLVVIQLPWLLSAVSLLHTNGFVGWFSLLSCFFCALFCITFLMRWLGVQYYRNANAKSVPPTRMSMVR